MQILVENDEGEEILLAESIEFERGKSALENLSVVYSRVPLPLLKKFDNYKLYQLS